jgi:hypothetical protein
MSDDIWVPIKLTIELATISTLSLLVVATPLAWWLARSKAWFKEGAAAFVSLPMVLPPTVLGLSRHDPHPSLSEGCAIPSHLPCAWSNLPPIRRLPARTPIRGRRDRRQGWRHRPHFPGLEPLAINPHPMLSGKKSLGGLSKLALSTCDIRVVSLRDRASRGRLRDRCYIC